MVHSVTKFTPSDAMKPSNTEKVKFNLQLKSRHSRKYPNLAIHDYVRVFQKKDKLDKEKISNWSALKYKVIDIQESMDQKFYKLDGKAKALMRSEILLVD